ICLQLLIASALIACAFAGPQDYNAVITKQSSNIDPEGTYQYGYETSNGIAAQEQGYGGNRADGGFAYTSPEGEPIQLSYVADENGFQPQGAHLPTPPPIPVEILKALEYIRTHPQYEEQTFPQQRTTTQKRIFG
ncbi:hypothetical protein KR222_000538, partial [Zaprionus bogoriensis]